MSLSTIVQARYSAQRLVNLTNPDDPTETTLDAAKLTAACDDAEAEFEVHVGMVFNETDARHATFAARGVIALLTERMGTKGGSEQLQRWYDSLKTLRHVTANDRTSPATNSVMQPTAEDDGRTTPVRPAFDDRRFRGMTVDPPHGPEAGLDSDDV
jgi:hypothetical protein